MQSSNPLLFLVVLLLLVLVSENKGAIATYQERELRAKAILPTEEDCRPGTAYVKTKASCDKAVKTCKRLFGIILKWTGEGTRIDGVLQADGGCQCSGYCGFLSIKPCSHDKQCYWNVATDSCYSHATRQQGFPITTCLTASPSHSPTTSKPSTTPTTSKPSHAPSHSPTTSKPSTTPTTSKPSHAPSQAPTTSKPSTTPTTSKPSTTPTTSKPSTTPTTSRPSSSPTSTANVTCCYLVGDYAFKLYLNNEDITDSVKGGNAYMDNIKDPKSFTFIEPSCGTSLLVFLNGDAGGGAPYSVQSSSMGLTCSSTDPKSPWNSAHSYVGLAWQAVQPIKDYQGPFFNNVSEALVSFPSDFYMTTFAGNTKTVQASTENLYNLGSCKSTRFSLDRLISTDYFNNVYWAMRYSVTNRCNGN